MNKAKNSTADVTGCPSSGWRFGFDSTVTSQIEITPRFAIRYGGEYPRVIALEWLWFTIYLCRDRPCERAKQDNGEKKI
jgi:hypothetical protein